MNRLFQLLIVAFWLMGGQVVMAQPSLILNDVTVMKGDDFEIELALNDAPNIDKMKLYMVWDSDAISFNKILDLNDGYVLGLGKNNFDSDNAETGQLIFDWTAIGIPNVSFDNMWLFRLSFKALQAGEFTISFDIPPNKLDAPRTLVRVQQPGNSNGGTNHTWELLERLEEGNITILGSDNIISPPSITSDSLSINLTTDKELLCIGDQLCFDVAVENFDSMISFQTPVFWDTDVLSYTESSNPASDQVKIGTTSSDGAINVIVDISSGGDVNLLESGLTLEDGANLVTLCYDVVGTQNKEEVINIGNNSSVALSQEFIRYKNGEQAQLEAIIDIMPFESIDCDGAVILNTVCSEGGSEEEEVCITVRANNFPNIGNFLYSHNWDPAIMDFSEVRSINSALSELQWDAGIGMVTMEWATSSTMGVTLSDNATMYDLCFTLKEGVVEGQSSEITINKNEDFFTNIDGEILTDFRPNDENCQIEVQPAPLPTVKLSIPDTTFIDEGSTKCIDVTVAGFERVDFLQFPLTWDAAVLSYSTKNNDALDGINIREVGTNELIVDWSSPNQTESLPDGTVLVSICFEAIGEANVQETSETALVFSGTDNILITRNNVELPVESPKAGLVILNAVTPSAVAFGNDVFNNLKRDAQVCVPVKVQNFENIIVLQTSFQWDSTVLRFDFLTSENLPALNEFSRDDVNTGLGQWNLFNEGQLNLSWNAIDDQVGESLANQEVLAEMCFTAIGKLDECTRLEISEALPFTQEIYNADEAELQLIDEGKDICITPFGIEEAAVEQPNCGGDGNIEIKMTGGTGYFGNWLLFLNNGVTRDVQQDISLPNNILNFDGISSNIDSICLTVVDRSDASLNDNRCWTIDVSDDRIPIALAGDDKETGCGTPEEIEVELKGDFEFGEEDTTFIEEQRFIDFEWTTIDGLPVDPFNPTAQIVDINSPGTYVLTVKIRQTGCSDTDTLEVLRSQPPTILIDEVENITCKRTSVELVGQSEEVGLEYEYEWSDEAGEILTGNSVFETEVSAPGIYTFTVRNTLNNCISQQNVIVPEEKTLPAVEAGNNMLKRCGDDFIRLDGTGSAVGARIEYEWTSQNGSGIINQTGLSPQVTKVGTYYLEVTDVDNGCISMDSVRVEADPELPVALVIPQAFIGCGERPVATLNGGPSREFTNANFSYTWEKNGVVIAQGNETSILDQTTVRDTGEYSLIIINEANDLCVADTATVSVSIDDISPEADIPTNITVGCSGDCIELPANSGSLSDLFKYEWSTEDGFICAGSEELAIAQISTFGTYKLILTNTSNNCSDTSQVFVFPDEENNVGADAGAPKIITCLSETVLLDGNGSSKEPSHLHEWRFEGQKISDSLQVMVSQPGTYELLVRDTETGCVDNASVKVTMDQEIPKVDAGGDIQFTGCNFPEEPPISLVATNSDSGEEFDIAWTTDDGAFMGDSTSIVTTIAKPGVYMLTITNKATSCAASDTVVVSSRTFTPIAIIESVDELDCINRSISLDANSSELDPGSEVEWSVIGGAILSGEDGLTPVIDGPGTYTLKITSSNGCEDQTDIVITQSESALVANVEMDNLRVLCNEQITIDGSASNIGDNTLVTWTTTDGNIISGANTLLPEVNTGGTYLLTLEDPLTNCSVTKEVLVETDRDLPNAAAGEDQEVCGREAILQATSVADNITGRWASLDNIAVANETETEIRVEGLSLGSNTFLWTLSTDECPEYSIDTVVVNVATEPLVRADNFTVTNNQGTARLDLIQNDEITSAAFDVNIITSLTNGNLTEIEEGIFEFSIPENFLGRQTFEYEVCSKTCSDVCANGSVSVAVVPETIESLAEKPNTITPNGDGKNDRLIFDELFLENFNDSELILFNRWGDVVFKESPYNNDWDGTGLDGSNLSEGTYYYILRLRIGEGNIIRGEVTVLR